MILFLRPSRGRLPLALGAFFVIFLSLAERDRSLLEGTFGVVVLGVLGALWVVLRALQSRADHWMMARRTVGLGFLFAAVIHLIHVPSDSHAWGDCLFAALVLSAALDRRCHEPGEQNGSRTFLLLMGVIASGFTTLAWTMHRLEWEFLYDWLPAYIVERYAALFGPLIAVRYALLVRTTLDREEMTKFLSNHTDALRYCRLPTAILFGHPLFVPPT